MRPGCERRPVVRRFAPILLRALRAAGATARRGGRGVAPAPQGHHPRCADRPRRTRAPSNSSSLAAKAAPPRRPPACSARAPSPPADGRRERRRRRRRFADLSILCRGDGADAHLPNTEGAGEHARRPALLSLGCPASPSPRAPADLPYLVTRLSLFIPPPEPIGALLCARADTRHHGARHR